MVYLLSATQLLKQRTQLWSFLLQSQEEDEVERFRDVVEEGEEKETEEPEKSGLAGIPVAAYNLSSREPLYCKAETTCLWELTEVGIQLTCEVDTENATLLY